MEEPEFGLRLGFLPNVALLQVADKLKAVLSSRWHLWGYWSIWKT